MCRHTPRQVVYDASGFLEKNMNALSASFADILSSSSTPLVRELIAQPVASPASAGAGGAQDSKTLDGKGGKGSTGKGKGTGGSPTVAQRRVKLSSHAGPYLATPPRTASHRTAPHLALPRHATPHPPTPHPTPFIHHTPHTTSHHATHHFTTPPYHTTPPSPTASSEVSRRCSLG